MDASLLEVRRLFGLFFFVSRRFFSVGFFSLMRVRSLRMNVALSCPFVWASFFFGWSQHPFERFQKIELLMNNIPTSHNLFFSFQCFRRSI
jgi:hypothetical protein